MSKKFNEEIKEDLINLYLSGENITNIATKLKVGSRQTIYDWLRREDVQGDIEERRRQLAKQGNEVIMKDINKYIANIQELANQKDDKRVALQANQYLMNRVYGNPNQTIINIDETKNNANNIDDDKFDEELDELDNEFNNEIKE